VKKQGAIIKPETNVKYNPPACVSPAMWERRGWQLLSVWDGCPSPQENKKHSALVTVGEAKKGMNIGNKANDI
jgi:hypothetical protein